MRAARYDHLAAIARATRARNIMEIGTCKGERAELMIRAAIERRRVGEIGYFGFDLFEPPPAHEFSARVHPWSIGAVADRINRLGVRCELAKGDSKVTLPGRIDRLPKMDLVFVDGGHSPETIASDWRHVRRLMHARTVVVFDDYWNYPGGGGCNALVDELKSDSSLRVEILEPADEFKRDWGTLVTRVVKVTNAAE